ncbi:MAG TPA: HAD family hydrolase [Fibrobacteraceae bacterium]|nr:HAD family hydrolase [Fibrobacteraceae bacterium]
MTWLFDYDLTLYGFDEVDILHRLDRNITRFLEVHFGWSTAKADEWRQKYCAQYGTTLGGLRALHDISPVEYFDFIHQGENLRTPQFNPRKRDWLQALPGTRLVFTNARRDWPERGLAAMGIRDCFGDILDIEDFGWEGKPYPASYAMVEDRVGMVGTPLILLDDKPDNLVTAAQRGWLTVLVHPQAEDLLPSANVRISHLMQLPPEKLLRRLGLYAETV